MVRYVTVRGQTDSGEILVIHVSRGFLTIG